MPFFFFCFVFFLSFVASVCDRSKLEVSRVVKIHTSETKKLENGKKKAKGGGRWELEEE